MFGRYELRTTDPNAARAFYSDVIGVDLAGPESPAEPATLRVWPLHEQARARGAPSHWRGHLGVTDLDATVRRLLELGSEPLGPHQQTRDGDAFACVRDPVGSVIAVNANTDRPQRGSVAWHQLHTRDLDRAWAIYAELFGWTQTETIDSTDPPGGHRMFAWDGSGKSVGSMANTAQWPGVHAHWLFYFPVADLAGALTRVRARGGRVVAPIAALPDGARIAPCEDPQGAAFGLHESA